MGGSFESWVLLYYGDYFVSWVLDGEFYWVLFYYGGYFVSWVFVGGFLLYLGFHVGFGCCGYVVSYGFFMWASWVAPVYTSCVLRDALRFFNEIFLLIKKNFQAVDWNFYICSELYSMF
jgi:hypothetical protein